MKKMLVFSLMLVMTASAFALDKPEGRGPIDARIGAAHAQAAGGKAADNNPTLKDLKARLGDLGAMSDKLDKATLDNAFRSTMETMVQIVDKMAASKDSRLPAAKLQMIARLELMAALSGKDLNSATGEQLKTLVTDAGDKVVTSKDESNVTVYNRLVLEITRNLSKGGEFASVDDAVSKAIATLKTENIDINMEEMAKICKG